MAEIVNLRRVKKQRARETASLDAAAARTRHGRSRAEREAATRTNKAQALALDGVRLDRSDRDRKPLE